MKLATLILLYVSVALAYSIYCVCNKGCFIRGKRRNCDEYCNVHGGTALCQPFGWIAMLKPGNEG
ncbi:hypothetical protein Ptr902_07664 [Pyrenophora tritici-repentis]|uniref:Uncharacterized protein n=1 Tax=Pyrenophora tritici-repentis TaxID=45151 RepID=A0A5M9LDV7_9PLEO|nr:hypothetical protein PtrV1_05977 [Pyrenophora tritici-repentis]KAF7450716.1 hypothetical protein A1F99_053320 [Pyrenophora tritici-repentis]KAF7573357.1 hypothetical protein PtrM4_082620 [Pyrenophora tritici-repentis]KAI0572257.1 hypothetical protein Alg130_10573 [Pyrenophora tritici-repentis]KAI0582024.1 hypothetical protein Alg215_04380 [Pyrenophora tritici-repentis]